MTGKLLAGFIGVVAFGMGLAGPSSAASITWAFQGEVSAISPATPEILGMLSSLGVSVGSLATGRLTFESTTPDFFPEEPARGTYLNAISLFETTIGAFHREVSTGPLSSSVMTVDLDVGQLPGSVFAEANGGTGYPFNYPTLQLYLPELAPGQIASDSLPLFPPPLSPLGADLFRIHETSGGALSFTISVDLTQIAAVPEPSLRALVAFAALALVAYRRR